MTRCFHSDLPIRPHGRDRQRLCQAWFSPGSTIAETRRERRTSPESLRIIRSTGLAVHEQRPMTLVPIRHASAKERSGVLHNSALYAVTEPYRTSIGKDLRREAQLPRRL